MTVDLSQVREDHGMVQAHAETAAFTASRLSHGVSFKAGYRAGWWDAVQWLLTAVDAPVVWPARTTAVHVTLLLAGVHRPLTDIDNAILAARDALHADEGGWYDPDSDRHWEVLEPHVLRFLDLTPTELQAVA